MTSNAVQLRNVRLEAMNKPRKQNYLGSTLKPLLRKSSRAWKSSGVALLGGPTTNVRARFSIIFVTREGKSSNSCVEINVRLRLPLSYISKIHLVCTIVSLAEFLSTHRRRAGRAHPRQEYGRGPRRTAHTGAGPALQIPSQAAGCI